SRPPAAPPRAEAFRAGSGPAGAAARRRGAAPVRPRRGRVQPRVLLRVPRHAGGPVVGPARPRPRLLPGPHPGFGGVLPPGQRQPGGGGQHDAARAQALRALSPTLLRLRPGGAAARPAPPPGGDRARRGAFDGLSALGVRALGLNLAARVSTPRLARTGSRAMQVERWNTGNWGAPA